jgi:Co/Zn/Cd efflux system component
VHPRGNQVLVVAIMAFGSITAAQTVAALMANSLALLGDCASMGVDTLTYVGNLYAETRGSELGPEAAQRRQLLASAGSLLVLLGVTSLVVVDAMSRLQAVRTRA